MIRIRSGLFSGIFGVLFGIVILLLIPSQVEMTAKAAEQMLNQVTMVKLSVYLMMGSGIVMIVQSLVLKKDKIIEINLKKELFVFLFWLVNLVSIFLMKWITFLGTSAIIILFSLWFAKKLSAKYIIGCVLFALVIYFSFKFLLGVTLP